MAPSTIATKKLHVSKNKKKTWRKHTNVDDVEEYLEDKRFEERTGGPVSEKSNESLFFVQKDQEPDDKTKFYDTVFKSKKEKLLDGLRCFLSLKNPSKVPPPIQVNSRTSTKKRKIWAKKKEKEKTQPVITKKKDARFYDIWNTSENVNSSKSEVELDKDLDNYIAEVTRKKCPKVPDHRYQKPSLLPAVEVPLPGTSYNPEYKDHQELLFEVAKVEMQCEKNERKIHRALTEKFPTVDQAPTEKTWLEEMSQGLRRKGEEIDEKNEEDEELTTPNPPVRFDNKKTKQKRNREKKEKMKLRDRKVKKVENKKLNEIYRLQSIKKEIIKKEEKTKGREAVRDKRLVEKMYKPKMLSQYRYEAPDIEFNLTEDLTGELRTVKVVGSILEDRYKSLQRRNIIEPRIRQKMKRKYKLKVFEKKGHREIQ